MRICALLFGGALLGCATGSSSPVDSGPALGVDADSSTMGEDANMMGTDTGTMGFDSGPQCPMTCPPGQVCVSGTCMVQSCGPDSPCAVGMSCCGGRCVSLPTDPVNCGACDRPCENRGQTCMSGQCRCNEGPGCTASQACCTDGCQDVQTDVMNCGSCGRMCPEGQVCMMGDCVAPPCDPPCRDGETCDAASLSCRCGSGAACAAGMGCCNDRCIDTSSDNANCGLCGNVCTVEQNCISGTCSAGPMGCDPECDPGESCVGGECRCGTGPACAGATQCCGGACVDTQSDASNCGFCSRTCGSTETCCTGACQNTRSNPDHCGGCNMDCTEGGRADTCTGGTCTCQGSPACGLLMQCFPILGCIGIEL